MNKAIVYLPLAFVAGGIVGAWGPGEELRALKTRPSAEAAKSRPAAGFDAFAKIVNIPDAAKHPLRHRAKPMPAGAAAANAATNATSASAKESKPSSAANAPSAGSKRMSPDDLRARIDEAAELWRTRVDIVRAKAVERLGLDESGAAKFDDAMDAMNQKLRESMQTIADMLADEEKMTPELGVRMMGDLCSTMAETYDQLGQCVSADRRDKVAEMELHNFIDPFVAEPLISVQGKLDGMHVGPVGGRR